jgi:hypothetical protein
LAFSAESTAVAEHSFAMLRLPTCLATKWAARLVHNRFGHPGEVVVEVDRGTNSNERFVLIATDAALYVYPVGAPRHVRRFTYRQLDAVYAQRFRRSDLNHFAFLDDEPPRKRYGQAVFPPCDLHRFDGVIRSRGRLPTYVRDAARAHPSTPPADNPRPDSPSGDRDPRRPHPSAPSAAQALAEPRDE